MEQPKFEIIPRNRKDKKYAKLMEELINYSFKNRGDYEDRWIDARGYLYPKWMISPPWYKKLWLWVKRVLTPEVT